MKNHKSQGKRDLKPPIYSGSSPIEPDQLEYEEFDKGISENIALGYAKEDGITEARYYFFG